MTKSILTRLCISFQRKNLVGNKNILRVLLQNVSYRHINLRFKYNVS